MKQRKLVWGLLILSLVVAVLVAPVGAAESFSVEIKGLPKQIRWGESASGELVITNNTDEWILVETTFSSEAGRTTPSSASSAVPPKSTHSVPINIVYASPGGEQGKGVSAYITVQSSWNGETANASHHIAVHPGPDLNPGDL